MTKVYRYRLSGRGHGGGVVFLDETGVFLAMTDFGQYGYWWPWEDGAGPVDKDGKVQDFREFIAGLALRCTRKEYDYLLGKVARGKKDSLDEKATQRHLKLLAFEHHKAYKRCRARNCTSCRLTIHGCMRPGSGCESEEFDNDWMRNELKWIATIRESHELTEHYHVSKMLIDGSDFPDKTWDSDAVHFALRLMPLLYKEIEKELIAEGVWQKQEQAC